MSFVRQLHTPALVNDLIAVLRTNGFRPFDGKEFWNVTTISSTYSVGSADCVILADATERDFTVTLPAAGSNKNRVVVVKKKDSSANVVTVARAGSDTIEGATSVSLSSQYKMRMLVSDGSATWYVLSSI